MHLRMRTVVFTLLTVLCLQTFPAVVASSPVIGKLPAVMNTGFDHRVVVLPDGNVVGPAAQLVSGRWSVVEVNGKTGKLLHRIYMPRGLQPAVLGFDAVRRRVVVCGSAMVTGKGAKPVLQTSAELVEIDPVTLRITRARVLGSTSQPLGFLPVTMAVSGHLHRLLLATAGSKVLTVDLKTLKVVRTVLANYGMQGQAVIDDTTGHAFLSTANGVVMLQTRSGQVLRKIALSGAQRVALDSARHVVVVASTGGQVDFIDTRTGRVAHSIQPGPVNGIDVDTHLGRVYLGVDLPSSGLLIADVSTGKMVRKLVPLLGTSLEVGVDPETGRVVVAAALENQVTLFDAGSGAIVARAAIHSRSKTMTTLSVVMDTVTHRAFILGYGERVVSTG